MKKFTRIVQLIVLQGVFLHYTYPMNEQQHIQTAPVYDSITIIQAAHPKLSRVYIFENATNKESIPCWKNMGIALRFDRKKPKGHRCYCNCGIGCRQYQSSNPCMIACACIPLIIVAPISCTLGSANACCHAGLRCCGVTSEEVA